MNFGDHQLGIYLAGMLEGKTPEITTDLANLESRARDVLTPEALGYIVPSAGSGATARANREAFDRHRIVPRMLRGVDWQRDLSADLLGTRMPAPVMIAPMGVQTLAHQEGELATVRAAAALGLTYVHSTAAAHSFEQVAEAGGDAPRWYQLYWPTDQDVCVSFLSRAKAAGFSVLMLTLDTTLLGWRPADLDRGFLPFLTGTGLANYLTDPNFAGVDNPVPHWAQMFPNPGLSWDDLPFLREHWDGPIVLKGIVGVEDARLAAEHGMDGIVVSNHGGRQVDGAVGALDALPAIAEAVGDRLTVLFDSGVRTGADVVKALALGARAVMIGRPVLYGLALGGQAGVEHVLRCLLGELDITLALSGHSSPAELGPGALASR
ncbi:alpha-hydroxy-acid oxidizing protein [Nonomuraea sp. NN258]|uniref:alpha-hydroxy-acid oxidizing protein n=1 Tax=Nonomuraea antri TaxID=2730852 RepID=UPI00156A6EAB|nr:alpha-hydroxy-acid oxidizing protein [Nonomuraea antri]NRQ36690.1 alpha-hydroxy-acid oxidizing protein [Nonomuraea antri]